MSEKDLTEVTITSKVNWFVSLTNAEKEELLERLKSSAVVFTFRSDIPGFVQVMVSLVFTNAAGFEEDK